MSRDVVRDDGFALRLRCFEVSGIDPRQQWRSTCDDTHVPKVTIECPPEQLITENLARMPLQRPGRRSRAMRSTSLRNFDDASAVAVAGQAESDRKAVVDEI